jgi:hypothetical protein
MAESDGSSQIAESLDMEATDEPAAGGSRSKKRSTAEMLEAKRAELARLQEKDTSKMKAQQVATHNAKIASVESEIAAYEVKISVRDNKGGTKRQLSLSDEAGHQAVKKARMFGQMKM